jgi:hypothetical protein
MGISTIATCPNYNTDENALDYILPRCNLGCSEPVGGTGYKKIAGKWFCAEGYWGMSVRVDCVTRAGCIVYPQLSGCVPVVPCRQLTLTGEDACYLDGEKCTNVMPMERCKINCKNPYLGDGTFAMCPAGNTDPDRDVQYYTPPCRCPWPFPSPVGYQINTFTSTWGCADGYHGTAIASCVLNQQTCQSEFVVTGCEKWNTATITPCSLAALTFRTCAR